MIERPASAGTGIAPAAAEEVEAGMAAPAGLAVAPLEAERSVQGIAAIGPDPALEPPTSPGLAERTRARFAHTAARPGARSTTARAPKGIERMEYRVIFACCTEATDAPTE
jgi:hypothetical protein